MAKIIYPTEIDLRIFIEIVTEKKYPISKYLPHIDEEWYKMIYKDCILYVEQICTYNPQHTIFDASAQLLYKIAKKHELSDGNKRSAVIAVFLLCLINDYGITEPHKLKEQAKRIARTKGRVNEDLLTKRIGEFLAKIIKPLE